MIAASLAAGYMGMMEKLQPSKPKEGNAYDNDTRILPDNIQTALQNMENCGELESVFSKAFLTTFLQIKRHEQEDSSNGSSSSWETKYILLTV